MSEAQKLRFTLTKDERLSRRKIISDLFDSGTSIKSPALILVYKEIELPTTFPAQVLFSASKRNFRRAHDRNRVKRLLREAWRRQKHDVYKLLGPRNAQLGLLFIFTGKQIPNYPYVFGKMSELIRRLAEELEKQKTGNETSQ